MYNPFVLDAIIERRLLVNFRAEADVLASLLPPPFEPRLISGWGMAGICLIGLRQLRPHGIPGALGVSTENAAHRIAVEWDSPEGRRQGVYIPRRDTDSLVTRALGGRLFPGVHNRGYFSVTAGADRISVAMRSADGAADVSISARVNDRLAEGSIFESLDQASHFFEVGSLGFSPASRPGRYEGLELVTSNWQLVTLAVEAVGSSFFRDRRLFPLGTVEFDSALLMRDVACSWRAGGTLESPRAGERQHPQKRSRS